MKRTLVWTSLVAILCAASASASPILISSSGTFSSATPSSAFSGPDETWAFSFLLDSNPVVSNVFLGFGFDPAFSDFSYLLNGSPVAIASADIPFSSSSVQGMFEICFLSACGITANGFSFVGPQMYSGSESAPTILTGDFTSTTFVTFFGTALFTEPNVTVQAASVPEPMTLSLAAAGILGLELLRRARLRLLLN